MPSIVSLGLGEITVLTHPLEPDATFTVDLESHGVPPDATIVDIVLTPNSSGDALPLAPALHLQHLHTRGFSPLLRVTPTWWIPESERSDHYSPTLLSIMAIWLPAQAEPEMEPLLSAAKAFTTGDFRGAIIPAQVAVELKLSKVLAAHLAQFGSREEVQGFLNNGATYGHQLRFLLPSLFGAVGAPALPGEVRAALQSLRKKRNQVGHEHIATERSEAGLMLVGALFGFWYLSIYGGRLHPALPPE